MQIPQIRMESTFIKLGLDIQKPNQQIEQPQAIQTIEQPQAIVQMETTPGRLTIDQTKAREDVDLKSVFRRTEEAAQSGYQDWMSGLARRAQQGTQLKNIQYKGNVIAHQAKANSAREVKQFNIGWLPSQFSVRTDYQPSQLHIDVQVQKPNIQVQTQKPIHDYTPGKVTPEVLEKNHLEIDFVNV